MFSGVSPSKERVPKCVKSVCVCCIWKLLTARLRPFHPFPKRSPFRFTCNPNRGLSVILCVPKTIHCDIWVWLKINQEGQTAGFGSCFHLPGFHFGTGFLSHSHIMFFHAVSTQDALPFEKQLLKFPIVPRIIGTSSLRVCQRAFRGSPWF